MQSRTAVARAGAASAKAVSAAYLSDPLMLFLGSFLMAAAVEKQGLHRRLAAVALRSASDDDPRRLLASATQCRKCGGIFRT